MKKHKQRTVVTEKIEKESAAGSSAPWHRDVHKRINSDYVDYAVATLFVLFCIVLVTSIRMLPAALPVTDSWADSTIRQNIRSQVAVQVDQQFPNLPDANRNSLIDQRTNEIIEAEAAQFTLVQDQLSQQFKSYMRYTGDDGKEYTYLGDLDSYFWLRYTRNYLETGTACDTPADQECRDMYVLAPWGTEMGLPAFHVYAIAWFHSFMTIFNPNYPLPAASFLIPVIVGALAVIPAFFIGRRLAGNVGGFFAAIIIALNPLYLSRSMGSDNDAWNIFIPLLVLWMIIEAVDSKSNTRRIIFGVLAGAAMAFQAAAWEGWWFIYLIAFFGLLGYLLFRLATTLVRERKREFWQSKSLQGAAIIFVVFYISTFLFLLPIGKATNYHSWPVQPFNVGTALDQAVSDNYWPNVLTTVAELNKSSIVDAINTLGGKLFFFIALIGMLLMILPRDAKWNWKHYSLLGVGAITSIYLVSQPVTKLTAMALLALPIGAILLLYLFDEEHVDVAAGIIVLVWLLATTYAVYSGVRFILLMIPAFGIAFGVAAGRAYEWLSRYITQESGTLARYAINTGIFLVLALVLIQPIRAGQATAATYVPSIDDAWWESLSKIEQQSAPDAIINSWWDFGHWFKYVADRRVSADGTTQHTHVPRWLGLALVTPNEDESIGILRMLDCGSDAFPTEEGWLGAYGTLLNMTNDPIKSEQMVRELVTFNKRSEAQAYLKERGFNAAQQEAILTKTHCDPPEDYLITSGDMVSKAGVWAHFGLWDFKRAYIVDTARDMPVQEAVDDLTTRFNYTRQEAETLYYEAQGLRSEGEINAWISPWPGYVAGWSACTSRNGTLTCPLGIGISQQGNTVTAIDSFTYNASNPQASAFTFGVYQNGVRTGGIENGTPAAIIIAGKNGMSEVPVREPQIAVGVLLDTEQQRVMVGDPALLRSTFTHLFYLDGRYAKHYEKFDDRTGFSGSRIIVWKVDWDGKESSATTTTANIR